MERRRPPFIRSRLNSFGYALKGISAAFRSEVNLRWHVISAGMVVAAGLYLSLTALEWVVICFAIGLVWMAELFNTALEVVVNLVSPNHHPLAGKAKDIAAGAVLVASLTAMVAGLFVFLPYLWALWEKYT
ncbi:diacylglycerol kinase family protein [Rufibacter glacialis]|uniref:Diacylglycerol kinase family protein n=1 Tax=Rufibacter glacialis TaxID=1259555 RepID=A0A5M8QF36_9BACT|nr:diacylglycerol kinase family protein [Rufibacter glacialis]KAA6433574.1 diacylglycerol kinase family protein [Rufibacter glacialis]GGK72885.1 diacylglycerol kinase [Rufibacter glacialis]